MDSLRIEPDKYPDISYNFIFLVDLGLVTFLLIGFALGVILLQNIRLNPRYVISIGGGIALVTTYCSSYARSLNTFLLFYCASSIGYGICNLPHVVCGWEYFPENRGLVNGIISSCYGFGTLYFAQLSTDLVNPDNKNPHIYNKENDVTYFDSSVASRVPYMLRELCIVWIGFVVVGIIFISRKELDDHPSEEGQATSQPTQNQEKKELIKQNKYRIKGVLDCLYSIRFWQLIALNTLGNLFATFFGYTCKTHGENKGDHEPISDELLTWANAFGAGIANGCARVLFGISCDYYNFRSVFIIAMSV